MTQRIAKNNFTQNILWTVMCVHVCIKQQQ